MAQSWLHVDHNVIPRSTDEAKGKRELTEIVPLNRVTFFSLGDFAVLFKPQLTWKTWATKDHIKMQLLVFAEKGF